MVLTFCEASATSMVNTVFSGPLKEVSLGMHHSLTAAVCAVLNNLDNQDCVEHTEESFQNRTLQDRQSVSAFF